MDRVPLVLAAVKQAPYGLVRPYVGKPVPRELDDIVLAAANGILNHGTAQHRDWSGLTRPSRARPE